MILETNRLRLAPLQMRDAQSLLSILGDQETMKFWHRPAIARATTGSEIIASQLAAMADGQFLYWTVWRGDDAIGSVDLSALDFAQLRGEVGFLFRRDQWGLGYGREATAALLAHAFGPLKLERLEARILAGNRRAKRLVMALGFLPEGRLAGHLLRDGVRHDVDVFGLLNKSTKKNGA
ncbi:MAG TPA: GNAT family N-acetyltransferase [Rhizomicrobium sp.]|nr:GNAT family N-acetyltransferase [Rhizomicrobium sp.]